MKMANNTYTDNKINASVAINDIPKALVNDWYVTGLTDSEGNFSINYNKNTNKVTFSYKITQKVHSIPGGGIPPGIPLPGIPGGDKCLTWFKSIF